MRRFVILLTTVAALLLVATPITAAATADPVVAAVGDIACPPGSATTATACHQNAVGALISAHGPDVFLPLGDEQYNNGALTLFNQSYDKAFGQLLPVTRPAPGNHEYGTAGASGYAAYYGVSSPYRYSFDVGTWHVVSLDSNCGKQGGCAATSPQTQWLKADLAAHPAQCTLAYWHHPRFNAGEHGGAKNMTATWKVLYAAHADVVLNGHEHAYTRYAPMTPTGVLDRAHGIREFVVGTGGKSHYLSTAVAPNTEYTNRSTFGALFLTLHADSYDWAYVTEDGRTLDSGTEACR